MRRFIKPLLLLGVPIAFWITVAIVISSDPITVFLDVVGLVLVVSSFVSAAVGFAILLDVI